MSICEFGNQRLDKSLHRPGTYTTQDFYRDLGYRKYLALDVNEKMGAKVCDLNVLVDINSLGQFDLVTDNGTGEHLFNQYAVWENQHRLTKQGGILLKIMPFTPWFNHGFYNFNPIIYRDVAAANNYKWLFFWLCDRDQLPHDLPTDDASWCFVEKRPRKLIEYASTDWKTDLYMVAAWQKVDGEPFKMPLQGKYKKDVTDDGLKEAYGTD